MITIKGIYGREMFETWYAMSAMLQLGPATSSPVITAPLPGRATGRRRSRPRRGGQCGKVVIDWSGGLMYGAVRDAAARRRWTRSATAGLYKDERQLASPQSAHVARRRPRRC